MPDLLLKEADIIQLDKLIAPIPTQYGLPIVNFLNRVGQIRAQEAAAANNPDGKDEAVKPEGKVVTKKQAAPKEKAV
jgi:hypothetical protein